MKLSLNDKRIQMGIVVIMGLFLLAGCGAQKVSTDGSISQSSLVDSAEKPVAKCVADPINDSTIGLLARVYEDANGPREDRFRIKFSRFPSTTFYSLRVRIFQVDESGAIVSSQNAQVQAEQKVAGQFQNLDGGTYTDIFADQIYKWTSTTASSVVNTMTSTVSFNVILPPDSSGKYDKWNVVSVGFYSSQSTGPTNISALIPAIYANPKDHAVGKSSTVTNLHPFINVAGLTGAEYRTRSESFCF